MKRQRYSFTIVINSTTCMMLFAKNYVHSNVISIPLSTKNKISEIPNSISMQESFREKRRRLQSNSPDAYPLFQDYGAYYADLYIGSPPQKQTVLVDTGSEKVGVPCNECIDCGHDHVDPSFNQLLSASFQYLQCSDCYKGRCIVNENTCEVRSEYVENSAWLGKEVEDTAQLSTSKGYQIDTDKRFPLKFSCMESVEGIFKQQLANGIMGLGTRKGSFWRQMYNQGSIKSQKFSICLEHHPLSMSMVGRLTLGGVDERLGHTASSMNYMDFTDPLGFYEVNIRKMHLSLYEERSQNRWSTHRKTEGKRGAIKINADDKILNGGGVIIDSGTTATLLSHTMKDSFDEAWKVLRGEPFPSEPIRISAKELKRWPTVFFQMKGSLNNMSFSKSNEMRNSVFDERFPEDLIVAMPPSHYMALDLTTEHYVPLIKFDGAHGEGSILGSNFMRSHDTLFDVENKRIGMVRSDCNFVDGSEAIDGFIKFPDPYANLNQVVNWYRKNRCKEENKNCANEFVSMRTLINFLCLLFLCTLIYWKPKRSGGESKT